MSTSSYQSALAYIHSFDDPYQAALRDHGKQTWGLSKITDLLERLGNPHRAYRVVHVAGTKGKGSTSAMIAKGLIEAGLNTGLYTSPHLQDWRERIQINRVPIAEDELVSLVEGFKSSVDESAHVSAFEVATALAFLHFKQQACDVAVIEVGLGGRLDATNVVTPMLSVITNISLDHMQLLGNTIAEIAAEKAAIIKPGVPVVSAPQSPEAWRVIEEKAVAMGSRFVLTSRDWQCEQVSQSLSGSRFSAGDAYPLETYDLALAGDFQIENAVVALAAFSELSRMGITIDSGARHRALANVTWPGRFEVTSNQPLCIIDSAHTPYSVEKLLLSLRELTESARWIIVFGCMADKDVDGMLRLIVPAAHPLIVARALTERAGDVRDLESRALRLGAAPDDVIVSSSVEEAVSLARSVAAPDDLICVTGSLSVVGEARTALRQFASTRVAAGSSVK